MTTRIKTIRKRGSGTMKLGIVPVFVVTLVSCATNVIQDAPSNNINVVPLSQSEQISSSAEHTQPTTDVTQIGVASTDYAANQIASSVDTPQLTVDQLKAYADRCAPGQSASTNRIDCSELSLRVRRVLKTDDKVAEALVVLNRLGRNGSSEDIDDELGRNRGELSYSAQAIASGALDAPPPTLPEDPVITQELESFLNEIGLGVNAGAIVPPGGG